MSRMAPSTVHEFLNVLETSYQVVRLASYARNRTTRLIKTPKLYWSNAGLALALGGGDPTGAHLENYVLTDLLAWRDTEAPRPDVPYWRTASGAEVDFVVERRQQVLAVEVKATATPSPRDAAKLRRFLDEYGETVAGGLLLLHPSLWLGDRLLATPWWSIL